MNNDVWYLMHCRFCMKKMDIDIDIKENGWRLVPFKSSTQEGKLYGLPVLTITEEDIFGLEYEKWRRKPWCCKECYEKVVRPKMVAEAL